MDGLVDAVKFIALGRMSVEGPNSRSAEEDLGWIINTIDPRLLKEDNSRKHVSVEVDASNDQTFFAFLSTEA